MTVARRLGRIAAALGLHVARRRDYHLVRRDFYSPIPDQRELPQGIRERRSPMRGIAFDTDAQITWAERELAPFVGKLEESGGFVFANGTYEHGDAEIAYAFVRWARSRRIVELGSGYSTMVLARAAAANAAVGHPTALEANDPHPRSDLRLPTVRRRPAQEIELDELDDLGEGDILFVDTTHVVKLGGDVNHVLLDLVPALAPGVLVHLHDIWLPYGYHPALTRFPGVHWNEQYLLQALLIGNPGLEVVFATHAVAVDHPERLKRLVPGYTGATYPTGFWMRRI